MNTAQMIVSFANGEASPMMGGRIDVAEKYKSIGAQLENVFVNVYGNAFRRPGTHYVCPVKNSDLEVRLIPFEFSTEQAYIIEASTNYFRFFKDNGQIYDGASPYEVTHTYTIDEIKDIQYAQSADTLYLCHPLHHPKTLTRSGHTDWTLEDIDFLRGPFLDDNVTATTITPSAATGTITLTASTAIFESDHIGSSWKVHTGWVKILGVTSSTVATAAVQTEPDGSAGTIGGTSAYTDWAEGAWSVKRGYPSCVTFYEQRLFFAGNTDQSQTVWGSVSQEYTNFEDGADDDDAVTYAIATEQVNSIRWLNAGKVLGIGTSGGIFVLSSGSLDEAVTPSNVVVKRETTVGSADIMPKKIGNYVYFVQRDQLKLREFAYTYEDDAYRATDATLLSEHITGEGINDLSYQESPNNILWAMRTDGEIATVTRQIEERVTAWTRQTTAGDFESVATITSDTYDQVWFCVKRTINGQDYRYIEYLSAPRFDDLEDAFFVDCGATYDSIETEIITGLDFLEGCTVSILADGATHSNKTVSGGSITLDRPASKVHVGLPYTSIIETMPIEGGAQNGTSQGKLKRIHKCSVLLYKTLGCNIGTSDETYPIIFRTESYTMDTKLPLFSGYKDVMFNKGYSSDTRVYITQSQPLPLHVIGIFPLMYTADV